MAEIPDQRLDTLSAFGPNLQYNHGMTIDSSLPIDKMVDTHCCFCGQQCGITLKVAQNQVVGFEPRYDFPFNKGLLCPKGVKRYLQGGHPDRLTTALKRDASAKGGFSEYAYDEAIKEVAEKIKAIQAEHGPSSVGVLSGASLTTEKAYLMVIKVSVIGHSICFYF